MTVRLRLVAVQLAADRRFAGYRSCEKVSSARHVRPFACQDSWMKECLAERGHVEVNLAPDHIDVNWQIDAIPQTLRLTLASELLQHCGVNNPSQLTIQQASRMSDHLKQSLTPTPA